MSNKTPKENAEKIALVPRRIKLLLGLVIFLGVLLVIVGAWSINNSNFKNQNATPMHEQNAQQDVQPQEDSGNKLIGRIGEGYFNFEILNTPEARTLGLSGRDSLAPTDALLFVFDQPDTQCFWMKDMKFNIDILWFDENNNLVYEKRNVSPDTYPESFCSDKPALYVVEVAAGVADANQITKDSKLEIEL